MTDFERRERDRKSRLVYLSLKIVAGTKTPDNLSCDDLDALGYYHRRLGKT